ncbi:hypothetical protein [Mastigocoleus testarum]|uniref:Uncharacterized protein n=1 Tax=Mastigocoleus testarum BC008 TaxID=371196 RepID=A0A0V7ZTL2_9CYAN|nr:hypothetical protein [Mastigocoleus testarum]KST67714.1 hypothetical protein BC008_43960 [Mastigocoleus testarum BC008]
MELSAYLKRERGTGNGEQEKSDEFGIAISREGDAIAALRTEPLTLHFVHFVAVAMTVEF